MKGLSRRSKLIMLAGIAISLAALPVIFFSRSYLLENGMERERASFANTVMLLEDSLSERYLGLLSAEARSLMYEKEWFLQDASVIENMLRDESLDRQATLAAWRTAYLEDDCRLDFFDVEGRAFFSDPYVAAVTAPGRVDFKGHALSEKVTAGGKGRRENVVTLLSGRDGRQLPFLVTFWPMRDMGCLVFAMPLATMQKERDAMVPRLLAGIKERMKELTLCEGGSIAIFDCHRTYLAGTGKKIGLADVGEDVLARARAGETLEGNGHGPRGEFIYRLTYFKALDWYVAAAAPMSSIAAPAQALTHQLLGMAAAALAVGIGLMLISAARTRAPLGQLTARARDLAAEDFSSETGISAQLTEGLPVDRNDEVGQLAGAFAHMVRALDKNIRHLKENLAVRQRMQGELNAARDIQMGILPAPDAAPRAQNYTAAAYLDPAKEVGGDLYDFFEAPDGRQVVVIGDVSDKGVSAALFMSMTVTLVRYAMADGLSCAEAMTRINDRLAENNPSCMFVTLFIGLFDPVTGQLDYASGGHCPPFVLPADPAAPVRVLTETSGPLVGAMEGMEYTDCHAVLAPGETCLLYTDGVSEAMDEAHALFTEERIATVLDGLRDVPPQGIIEGVLKAVEQHRGTAPQSDDITMLCFKRG
ncbi:MAG: SpoIIE family protein phosphatase [Mailhella sp.]|nr:SpoIIE family protein phosphatase [Mailhella sp.]